MADIKKTEKEIYRSIPQIMFYALVLKAILAEYGCNVEIKCVGFTFDLVLEFDPKIMREEIVKFLDYEASISKREIALKDYDKSISLKDLVSKTMFFIEKK